MIDATVKTCAKCGKKFQKGFNEKFCDFEKRTICRPCTYKERSRISKVARGIVKEILPRPCRHCEKMFTPAPGHQKALWCLELECQKARMEYITQRGAERMVKSKMGGPRGRHLIPNGEKRFYDCLNYRECLDASARTNSLMACKDCERYAPITRDERWVRFTEAII